LKTSFLKLPDMPARRDPLLTISQTAHRSGVAPSALRYYESLGLIQSLRAASGHRRYHRSMLRRVAFIVFAQKIGFTLEEVAAQLDGLPKDHAPTGADWARLSRGWKARVELRIEELQRLNMGLDGCIGCGCLSLKRCHLANPDDRAARQGAGAIRWLGGHLPTEDQE
jgi:MerR family redox-sensitive transcriptional activator SoxR